MYICIEPLQPAPRDFWPRVRALNSGRPHAFSQKAQRAKSELAALPAPQPALCFQREA